MQWSESQKAPQTLWAANAASAQEKAQALLGGKTRARVISLRESLQPSNDDTAGTVSLFETLVEEASAANEATTADPSADGPLPANDDVTDEAADDTPEEEPLPEAVADALAEAAVKAAEAEATLAAVAEERDALAREREVLGTQIAEREEGLTDGLGQLAQAVSEMREQMAGTVVRLATLVARRLVGRELEADPELAVTLTRSALAQLEGYPTADVHVHPTDFSMVQRALQGAEPAADQPLVRVFADGNVGRGGCRVVTEGAEVDGRLPTRLARLEKGLLAAMTSQVAEPVDAEPVDAEPVDAEPVDETNQPGNR